MQILQAGNHQLVALEYDNDTLRQIAGEAGLEIDVQEKGRSVVMHLSAPAREGPFLLFDAGDASNTGWFSRCHFYVDGRTGSVMQTPFTIAHQYDPAGRPLGRELILQMRKELPPHFRMPGRQALNEKQIYTVLYNFLNAICEVGVGVCGTGSIRPLAGRSAGGEART
jgi:hypothetical protein